MLFYLEWIKPEKYFCLKLKVLVLGSLILQMSHESNLSFNLKKLLTVRVFILIFPHVAFEALKKTLKSSEKFMGLYSLASRFKTIVSSS